MTPGKAFTEIFRWRATSKFC